MQRSFLLLMNTENNQSTTSIPKQEQNRSSNNNNNNRYNRGPRPDNRGPRTDDRTRNGGAGSASGGNSVGGSGGFALLLKNPYKVQRIRTQPEPVVVREGRRDSSRSVDSKEDENRRVNGGSRISATDVATTTVNPKRKSTVAVTSNKMDDESESSTNFRPAYDSTSNGRYIVISSSRKS
jgi:hypothetical protein